MAGPLSTSARAPAGVNVRSGSGARRSDRSVCSVGAEGIELDRQFTVDQCQRERRSEEGQLTAGPELQNRGKHQT